MTLMAAWPHDPALIYDLAYDVLAANMMADALFGGWPHSHNLLEVVFGDPLARSFYVDWADVAADAVAGFRFNHGRHPNDPRVRAVLSRMLTESPSSPTCGTAMTFGERVCARSVSSTQTSAASH